MKFLATIIFILTVKAGFSQATADRLSSAIKSLQKDAQFKHAIISMYVVDAKTGAIFFEKDAQLGMVPASVQKVITSVSAFELLGKEFTYKTTIGFDGKIEEGILNGNLYFTGTGDPTMGSWRWRQTREASVEQAIISALKAKNISTVNGDLIVDAGKWETQATPKGWVWEDVGNYFGAGVWGINWHENQYDLILKPGKKEGDAVEVLKTDPPLEINRLMNELKTGKEGSGDQSIIYLPENGLIGIVRGTIPAGNDTYIVKGSIPDAPSLFLKTVDELLARNNIKVKGKSKTNFHFLVENKKLNYSPKIITSLNSPTLDSINFWFLKKSVNLFGEAFLKSIAFKKTGFGNSDSGIAIIRDFWKKRGIENSALKLLDGSGLSPANRVTSNALVTVMQYAAMQSWFPSFYNALPEMNGIKMKDGYIGGVRSYTGYVKSKAGDQYTFALIVNNFDGNPGTVKEKMWKLLDILK